MQISALTQALYAALQHRAGLPIVESLADEIVAEVAVRMFPDYAPDPARFPVEQYNGLTFQVERMRDLKDEIKPLHWAHWQETEKYRHGQPFNPNYAAFIAYERAGHYVLFTVRDADKRLVGNCAVYVFRSNHTQELEATEDTMFLLKEVRKGRQLGVAFFQYCERMLLALGVVEIKFSVKTTNAVWRLWRRLGYEVVAYELSKQLRRADDAAQV